MLARFLLYGMFGWCAEVLWTALYEQLSGTRRADGDSAGRVPLTRAERLRAQGKSYLWMFPLYGGALLLFEPAHRALAPLPWPVRGAVYAAGCFTVEAAAGLTLLATTGRCPWDYSHFRFSALRGTIRWDYAPLWFLCGLIFERVHAAVAAAAPVIVAALH